MKKVKKEWLVLSFGIGVALLTLGAIACSDDPSEEEAVAQLCEDITELRAAAAAFSTLSTVDEVNEASTAVGDALNAVVDSAKDVASASSATVEDAYSDLERAIDDISDDDPIQQAVVSITDEVIALENAFRSAFSGVTCPS